LILFPLFLLLNYGDIFFCNINKIHIEAVCASMKILFIGNSYTFFNDMPKIFENLANDNGIKVEVHSITKGGRRLESYADSSDPITESLLTLLGRETFDVCFIQEQSVLPALDFDRFVSGLSCVIDLVKDKCSRLILYSTWGRKEGSEKLAKYHWTSEYMTGLLSDAYQRAAALFDVSVSSVGINFMKVSRNCSNIDLYRDDFSHPSYHGSCLAALTHYHTVFGCFPENTRALMLSSEEINVFRMAICDTTAE